MESYKTFEDYFKENNIPYETIELLDPKEKCLLVDINHLPPIEELKKIFPEWAKEL